MSIKTNNKKVKLLLYGDSITEPESYFPKKDFNSSWTQLVINNINGIGVSSGRGGYTAPGVIWNLNDELPYIDAEYVMVTIGTNGGNTEENLTNIINIIHSNGSIPLLNKIPCNDNNGESNNVEVNNLIETLRQRYNIKGCDMNIPTSLNGDGINVDRSTMYKEELSAGTWYHHPNVLGSKKIFLQMMKDLPELF